MPDCSGGQFLGRTVTIGVSLACSATVPASFDIIGTSRGLSFSSSRGTVDVTNRSSGNVREYINDYLDGTISCDGTLVRDAADQSKLIREYFLDSSVETAHGWIQLTIPEETGDTTTLEVPVVFTAYDNDFAYETLSTFSFEANFNGAPVLTDIPAPAE